ncbi:hypothetical protein [Brachyspira hyodysenteriae]|uniref:hypothetical protein n=1 Tax=Brachyspira hyodysenteriae TaxID=159 RepID=UPI0011789AF0|nr:hypothetical protein [Brachyspira hyodysenteriae]
MALKQKAKIMIIDYFHYYDTIHSIMSILATSNKQQATSNKQQATSNKQQATSNKQQATSNKQQATSITTLTNSILIAKKYFINLNILSIFYGVIYEN